nr:reverse transcriptase domain-containing protein [Tanacetum cinerariifolium]
MFKQLHININLVDALILIPKYQKMLRALLSNKEKLLEMANTPLNENCSAVILKKLPKKLGDPGKVLISCGFSLPKLISTRMTLELANRAICTPTGIARDVFVPVGKFTFPADFVIFDYESDPRVPIILGRPFLRTARALINVHGEEMILYDGDERLTLNMRHDTSSYSNKPKKESINMINIFNDSSKDFLENLFATNHQNGNPTFSSHPELTSSEVKDDIFDLEGGNVLIEKFLDLDSTKDLPLPHNINPLSCSTTSSSSPNHLLEEFADELALITFPLGNDDLPFDIGFDHKEIEYLLNNDPIKEIDSILEDSDDEDNLDDLNDNLADTCPRCSPMNINALPSTNNEDKVFNLGTLIQKNLSKVNTRVAPDKNVNKIAISHASLILEDFDSPLYKHPFLKEVPGSETLLSFSSENEEKLFKPGILTSKRV